MPTSMAALTDLWADNPDLMGFNPNDMDLKKTRTMPCFLRLLYVCVCVGGTHVFLESGRWTPTLLRGP